MRRAQENSSVSGQTGRELTLIQRELQRRKKSNSPVLPTMAG
jgi:proline dehydrogenase